MRVHAELQTRVANTDEHESTCNPRPITVTYHYIAHRLSPITYHITHAHAAMRKIL